MPGVAGLLLAGVAITAVAFSLIGLLTFMASGPAARPDLLEHGQPGARQLDAAGLPGPLGGAAVGLDDDAVARHGLLLGEREAQHLGYALKPLRVRLVLASALIIGRWSP